MKIIKKILNRIDVWRQYHDPLYWWWKARGKYPLPHLHLVKGEYYGYFGMPISNDYYKGLQLHFIGLGWKWKFDSVRHEWNPIICFTWKSPFKTVKHSEKFGDFYYHKTYWFGWIFHYEDFNNQPPHYMSSKIWESMVEYVYNKKNETKN